jgi:hypothetical protein
LERNDLFFIAVGLILVGLAGSRSSAQPAIFPSPLSPRIANYEIEVRLDPDTRRLEGRERLVFSNATGRAASELRFHLYLNAFRNTRSTFITELGYKTAAKEFRKDGWGFMEINHLSLSTGEDLTPLMEYVQPDDGNTADKTVLRLPLPRALGPGKSIVVNIDFSARLPQPPLARTGCKGDFCFAGQWFPKVGVWEEEGWNCHQFHANSEFFADFGVYDVRITVPGKNLVGATGVLVERVDNDDGTATHWFHAEDVHDFAWTTSPHFVEFTGEEGHVSLRVLMHREHAGQGARHLEAGRVAVRSFQERFGEYPYPNLTIVDPRIGAGGAGGMEYPTLITAGTFIGLPEGIRAVEAVIIHEFGHNFWYGMVASNEFEEAWLDEGINTYSEISIMHDLYGAETSLIDFLGIKGDDLLFRRFGFVQHPGLDPVVQDSWKFYSRASYGANVYDKAALMMLTLENYLGAETMERIMRTYFERWRFKHPRTHDFLAVVNEVTGQDLSWFFEPALFDKTVLDYAVTMASAEKMEDGKGYDYSLAVPEGEGMEREKQTVEKRFLNKVRVRRVGDFRFPVEVEMEFADGSTVRESWDGGGAWIEFVYELPVKLVRATVDPERKVLLDIDWKNNSLACRERPRAKKAGYLEMFKFMRDPR